MVDLVSSLVDPTLLLKSEVEVVDSVSSTVNPTLPLKSEVKVVNSDLSMVDPTLLLKNEVQVVESMSSSPNPTLSLESVMTEVVAFTKSSSCYSFPLENELKPAEVFMLRSDYSRQEEILSLSIEHSPSTQVIYFD